MTPCRALISAKPRYLMGRWCAKAGTSIRKPFSASRRTLDQFLSAWLSSIRPFSDSGGWVGGTVVGDYTVPVLERIPPQAFDLARAGKKRPLVLRFRIRDDGVDFGWMVRLQDGVPFEVLMRGGDF
jgi:hypothetical protein